MGSRRPEVRQGRRIRARLGGGQLRQAHGDEGNRGPGGIAAELRRAGDMLRRLQHAGHLRRAERARPRLPFGLGAQPDRDAECRRPSGRLRQRRSGRRGRPRRSGEWRLAADRGDGERHGRDQLLRRRDGTGHLPGSGDRRRRLRSAAAERRRRNAPTPCLDPSDGLARARHVGPPCGPADRGERGRLDPRGRADRLLRLELPRRRDGRNEHGHRPERTGDARARSAHDHADRDQLQTRTGEHTSRASGPTHGESPRPRRRRRRMQTDARNRRCPPARRMHPDAGRRLRDRGPALGQRDAARPEERAAQDQDLERPPVGRRQRDGAERRPGLRRARQHPARHDGAGRTRPRSRTDSARSPQRRPAAIRRAPPRPQGDAGGRRKRRRKRRRGRIADQRQRAETGQDAALRLRHRQEVQAPAKRTRRGAARRRTGTAPVRKSPATSRSPAWSTST